MNRCAETCSCANPDDGFAGARFPDLAGRLRLSWRDVFRMLAEPAVQMHHYRNLRGLMLDEAFGAHRDECER